MPAAHRGSTRTSRRRDSPHTAEPGRCLDPADVGIDDDRTVTEREGRHGRGRVVADAGQGPQRGLVAGHLTIMPLDDGTRGLVEPEGAARGPEPAPRPDHLTR